VSFALGRVNVVRAVLVLRLDQTTPKLI